MPIDPVPPIVAGANVTTLNEGLPFSAPVVTTTSVASDVVKGKKSATTTTGGTTTTSGPSASGSLNAIEVGGTTNGDIAIFTRDLPADTYTITSTTISTGASITLGTLTIPATDPTPPIFPIGPIDPIALGVSANGAHTNVIIGGPVGPAWPIHIFQPPGIIIFSTSPNAANPLPSGFDLFDVASVTITNSSSVVVLASTASPVANGQYRGTAAVTTGPDATSSTKGFAQVQASAVNGKVKGLLSVRVSGAPASTTYTYAINGTDVGPVTTNAKGHLSIYTTTGQKKSPLSVNPFTITAVTVHDATGALLVSASF
jgi:hypothetical protein